MKLLFYPSPRFHKTRIRFAIDALDYLTIGSESDYDVCFHWNYRDVNDVDSFLMGEYDKGERIVNYWLRNVTKKAVDEYMTKALGYSSLVDEPYEGLFISKRNKQSRGEVNLCYDKSRLSENGDMDKYSPDYRVHQRFIDTAVDDTCIEHRVLIFGDEMFVMEKRKPKAKVFKSNADGYTVMDVSDVFTLNEIDGIQRFCAVSGLDFGEIDVLRDSEDGRIYITDINNISGGAAFFAEVDGGKAVSKYIEYFDRFIHKH